MNATAKVIGAPFPLEVGRAQILATSIPHLREGAPTTARTAEHEGTPLVLLVRTEDDKLECILRLGVERDQVSRIEYLTVPNARDEMLTIADAKGLSLPDA